MEIWKNIKGFEGIYQASNLGNIRSLDHVVDFGNRKRTAKGKLLNFNLHKSAYLYVHVGKKRTVHRLVAETFIPNPEKKPFVNHKNGNRSDNRVVNLEWCTEQENCIHGLTITKRKVPKHYKLTEEQVQQIKHSNKCKKLLCHDFNISLSTVYLIKRSLNH